MIYPGDRENLRHRSTAFTSGNDAPRAVSRFEALTQTPRFVLSMKVQAAESRITRFASSNLDSASRKQEAVVKSVLPDEPDYDDVARR